MFFSVVVPVYNVEKYLGECLQSLSAQSFRDFEIILVDDGSTDNSGKLCDEFAKCHDNAKVIHKKNEGLLLARRTGIRECTGDFIIHCDSDDYIASDALEKISEVIVTNHPDMVMYGYDVVDDERAIKEEHFTVFADYQTFDEENKEELILQLCSSTWLNNMVTKATRRELVDVDEDYTEFKSLKMGEDLFQVIPLVKQCKSFVYIAKPLYFYRYNPAGMSKNINRSYLDNHFMVSDRLYELLRNEEVTQGTLISFYNRYVKDLYKYVLRFVKAECGKEEFETILKAIKSNKIYLDAEDHYDSWTSENKLFHSFIRENNYVIVKMLTKTVLNGKI